MRSGRVENDSVLLKKPSLNKGPEPMRKPGGNERGVIAKKYDGYP